MILLVAMVGAIVLTLRHKAGVKRQSIAEQVARTPATAIEIRKVEPGKGPLMTVGLSHYLTVAAILFTIGIFGIFINRKNVIVILMSVELILLAVNINLVAFSAFLGDLVGQVFALLVLTVAAAEAVDRPRHPRRLLPQPRLDRGRRRQHDEGLTAACIRRSSSCRCSARSSPVPSPSVGACAGIRAASRATHGHGARPCHGHAACARRCTATTMSRPRRARSRPRSSPPASWSIAAVLSWVAFFTVGFGGAEPQRIQVLNWFTSGTLAVDWAFRIDTLTVVMLVVVNTVSALVHVYSIGYMAHDPHRPRFFAYLSLFTFAMLALVTADNLVQLFFGWEGVGLASYLLIGFWYKRPSANAAAIKAFVVNRVGDFGFALGIFGVFVALRLGRLRDDLRQRARPSPARRMHFLSWDVDALTVLCLLLFMGAMGKSAQFLLHTWLPDAMEGPTPVSALIHAATMVTAGVFMVARLSPLFELAPVALTFVTFIGATTAFFAATVGLVQNDIKRVVAYSTCSQLGYMFVALGVGAYPVGDLPPLHPRLLQGAAVPRLRLGHPRRRRRAGHAQDGRPAHPYPAHLLDDGHRHAGADRLPAHRRLLLQGRDHRGGLCRHQRRRRLRLRPDRRRRADDRVLLVAPDLHDLPRQRRARRPR